MDIKTIAALQTKQVEAWVKLGISPFRSSKQRCGLKVFEKKINHRDNSEEKLGKLLLKSP
jgi:hypothetical protein